MDQYEIEGDVMSQYVMMAVKCINSRCKDCPDLDLIVDKDIFYADDKPVSAQNDILCRHQYECETYGPRCTHQEHAL